MNSFQKIELQKKANQFRNENGYSAGEPVHLSSLLLKRNVITAFKPMSDSFSGMAIKTENDIRFLLINRNNTVGRQHFTIGHELYHIFIQDDFQSQKCKTGLFNLQTEIDEKKADYFAACLLLPETGLTMLIPQEELQKKNQVSSDTIFKIQQYFSMSIDAVIYRLVDLGIVDNSYFSIYKNEKKSTARKLGYDMVLYEPRQDDKFIGDYGVIANELFRKGKISESLYFELLNALGIDPFANSNNEHE